MEEHMVLARAAGVRAADLQDQAVVVRPLEQDGRPDDCVLLGIGDYALPD